MYFFTAWMLKELFVYKPEHTRTEPRMREVIFMLIEEDRSLDGLTESDGSHTTFIDLTWQTNNFFNQQFINSQ